MGATRMHDYVNLNVDYYYMHADWSMNSLTSSNVCATSYTFHFKLLGNFQINIILLS